MAMLKMGKNGTKFGGASQQASSVLGLKSKTSD